MMTQTAIEADKASGATLLRVDSIVSDADFNCRGQFTANNIIELARDVGSRGLIQPIIVRKLWDTEKCLSDRGYRFFLIAGFRRLASYKVNKAEVIPAIIRGITSDFDARDINAVENLQRLDLTFWQEAKSIRHYWVANWVRNDIAERIGKSPGWVQLRVMLLEMEPEIQNAAEQGYILPSDMHELYKYKGKERLEIAGRLRDARKTGKGKNIMERLKKRDKPNVKRLRKAPEIQELSNVIRTAVKEIDRDQEVKLDLIISPQGNMLLNRVLAWCTGEISSFDVHVDIRAFCRKMGSDYEMPLFSDE